MQFLFLLLLLPVFLTPIYAESQQLPTDKGILLVNIATEPEKPIPDEQTKLKIDFVNPQTNLIQEHIDYTVLVTNAGGSVFGPIPLTHTSIGTITIPIQFKDGDNKVVVDIQGILFQPIPSEKASFSIALGDKQTTQPKETPNCKDTKKKT